MGLAATHQSRDANPLLARDKSVGSNKEKWELEQALAVDQGHEPGGVVTDQCVLMNQL